MFGLVNLDEDMCKIIPLERAFVNIYILIINFYLLLPFFVQSSDDSGLASNRSVTSSNAPSRQNSINPSSGAISSLLPELEIGLAYDKDQSTLVLEIGKGINFGMTSQGRAPGRQKFVRQTDVFYF